MSTNAKLAHVSKARHEKYAAAQSTVDACEEHIFQLEQMFRAFANDRKNEAFRCAMKDAQTVFKQTKRSIKEAHTQIEAAALFIDRVGGREKDN